MKLVLNSEPLQLRSIPGQAIHLFQSKRAGCPGGHIGKSIAFRLKQTFRPLPDFIVNVLGLTASLIQGVLP
jgi:hypothetical protein